MRNDDKTCWTLIHLAAKGEQSSREAFVELYQPVIRVYFESRWSRTPQATHIDDAIQETYVECFKEGGVLEKVAQAHPQGFRRFLHGVLRNIARRVESKRSKIDELLDEPPDEHTSSSKAFDRAWAQLILRDATRIQLETAKRSGERALKRVELLRLRFQENYAIRDIASLWGVDAANLHHEYATARQEFGAALRQAIAFQTPQATPEQLRVTFDEFLELLR